MWSSARLRSAPKPRGALVDRFAVAVLERELAHLEGGSLEVTLPDGTTRTFGAGPAVSLRIHDRALFRRLATRGKVGFGESYTAGEWDTDDLVGLFALLLRNAEAAVARNGLVRRVVQARPRPNRRNGLLRARRNIAYHYDLGNELFAADARRDDDVLMRDLRPSRTTSLADAQRAKLQRVCDQLQLTASTTTCSRSAAGGAASRCTRRARPAAGSPG